MKTTLCQLGRQPAISLAELESLCGTGHVTPLGTTWAAVDAEVDVDRLGASIKTADHITRLPSASLDQLWSALHDWLGDYVQHIPEGKILLGVSLYGIAMPLPKLSAAILRLKKTIRTSGRSVRVVPNTELALSSAQTYHNHLTRPTGIELVCIHDGNDIVIGRVTHVQNIDSYRIRDRDRPRRDAFVGMLPPKLAQTIINLAVGQTDSRSILDPFCGTGVILQEALLMGYAAYGSDLSEKMITYSRANLAWLQDQYRLEVVDYQLTQADAMTYSWSIAPPLVVACEGYLGQPLGGQSPTPERLSRIIADCDYIMRTFLTNIYTQLPSGTRLCIAAPSWHLGGRVHHLPVLDSLEDMGYNRIDFEYAGYEDLIYRRDDQIVGRELLVVTTR